MNTFQIKTTRLAVTGALLISTQAAQAWTAADCNRPPFSTYSRSVVEDCQRKSLIQQQQLQADGSQPTEAQRLARVREILRKQKVIELREVRSPTSAKKQREAMARCEPRLKDLLEGKGFEPIEPVFILDDVWQWDLNGVGELRVPAIWNSCANAEYRTNFSMNDNPSHEERIARIHMRSILSFTGSSMNTAQPPHRLYALDKSQRPSHQWQYMVDRSLGDSNGSEGHWFGAISFKTCEVVGNISSNPELDPSTQQSWALTNYGKEIVVARIVDGFQFQLNSHNPKNSCSWVLFPKEPAPKR